ncbi:ribosome biogenesis GTPase [Oikeobacillus pervagus]|uniref:Small ribosomal subunit biogenesis GTPase RsgA n=1 Tax=Oikeobacillus pervagus TaxID=1325931 RepID=A0AAJ1SYD9_9BACI|nr:ribosome small subunit-dependent GTPase A [Oikeobacillus pervagus]MDQ0215080.1 ribosome biogenesis GTPase [Oikeobacillus pervagus]
MEEGKIIKALSGFYYVITKDERIVQCRGRGVFRKQKITPLVGDFVQFQAENDHEGYILNIFERKNELVRPPISNVDQAILVFSAANPDFSTSLLDRFLVLIESKKMKSIICITKLDLLNESEKESIDQFVHHYRSFGYEVILTSSILNEGLDPFIHCIQGKTSVFAGQSGVGKSSLLNAIRPDLQLKTGDISQSLGRGKHTTRHVELIKVEEGLIADTPGFSSLELTEITAEELAACFPEMVERSHECKFRGCLHLNEPKCQVKAAVENGEIPSYRYEHYQQFMEEIKERKPRY